MATIVCIRNMSDEELAEVIPCPYMKDEYDGCRYGWHEPEMSCEQCKLQWLKSEREVENDADFRTERR